MAAPTFVTASAGTTDSTGAWTHTGAAPSAAGNFYIVHILDDGTAGGITITSVTNAENLAGTDNVLSLLVDGVFGNTGLYAIGSPDAAYQRLYMGRALNTSAMVITGANASGDDVYVRVYEFTNVATGTTIATVLENGSAGAVQNVAGTSATCADASVETIGTDRLALNFVGINDDASGLAAFTGETGGDWTLATAIYESSTGTDGTIGLMQAAMASAGTIDGGTDTITSLSWGTLGFALIGTTVEIPILLENGFVNFNDPGVL